MRGAEEAEAMVVTEVTLMLTLPAQVTFPGPVPGEGRTELWGKDRGPVSLMGYEVSRGSIAVTLPLHCHLLPSSGGLSSLGGKSYILAR